MVAFAWPTPPEPETTPTTQPTRDKPADPDGDWKQYDTGRGAKLLAPGPLESVAFDVRQGNALKPGTQFTAADAAGNVGEVFRFEHENGDQAERVASFLEVPAASVNRVGVKPFVGGDATEYAATADGFDHAALVIGHGGVWYLFHFKLKSDESGFTRRKEQFFAKAEVNWARPADPAPVPPKPVKPKDTSKPTEPKPLIVRPVDPKGEAEPITETWVAVENKSGFAAVAPKGVRPERLFVEQSRLHLGGSKWQTDDGQCVYHVSYLDLPDKFDADVPKLLKAVLPFGLEVGADSDGTAGGKKATVWQLKNWDKPKAKAVTVRCGFRLFVAFAASKHGKGYGDDATFTQRADKFFAGLKFTFDPQSDDPYAGDPKWASVPNAVGFTAKVPKGNTAVKSRDIGGNPKIVGKEYRSEGGGMVFEVFVHDLPAKRTAADVTKELLGFDKLVSGPTEVRGAERRWTTYELGSPERPVLFRTATAGSRVFTVRVYPERNGDERVGARELRDKAAQFFEQFSAED